MNWISVIDRLPLTDQEVLYTDIGKDGRFYCVAQFSSYCFWQFDPVADDYCQPTMISESAMWIPLPEPLKPLKK